MSSRTGTNSLLQPQRENDNMISSDWSVLDCFTDWSDAMTGLTPAGELPFHLHIEVLGLYRNRQREGKDSRVKEDI